MIFRLSRARWILTAVATVVLGGCVSTDPSPSLSDPIFYPDPTNEKYYRALTLKQEQLLPKCEDNYSCAHVHFSLALLSLFTNREAALHHFNEVLDQAPHGRLSSSSKVWIDVIGDDPEPNLWNRFLGRQHGTDVPHESLVKSAQQLVRDLLDREMIIQQLMYMKDLDVATLQSLERELSERGKEVEKLLSQREALQAKKTAIRKPSLHQLQRQLVLRDKKIVELTNQLEALKRIDQEMREKTRPGKVLPSRKLR